MKTNESENFIKITTSLRKRKDLSPTHKYVLSYLLSFQQNGKACFQTQEEIAEELGMKVRTLKNILVALEERGFVIKDKASKWSGKRQYKNRKALLANLDGEDISDIQPVLETIEDTTENIQEAKQIAKEDMEDSFESIFELNDNSKGVTINDMQLTVGTNAEPKAKEEVKAKAPTNPKLKDKINYAKFLMQKSNVSSDEQQKFIKHISIGLDNNEIKQMVESFYK